MTPEHRQWIKNIADQAETAGHIFPEMAACEAALESSWAESQLAKQDNNLFGMKQHFHAIYDTVSLPTSEFLHGEWKVMNQDFVKYENIQECFEDRMNTLKRLAPHYMHYAEALAATNPQEYIKTVSATWSTDPKRAEKVQAIYDEFKAPLSGPF